jgi:hypothetical protein
MGCLMQVGCLEIRLCHQSGKTSDHRPELWRLDFALLPLARSPVTYTRRADAKTLRRLPT